MIKIIKPKASVWVRHGGNCKAYLKEKYLLSTYRSQDLVYIATIPKILKSLHFRIFAIFNMHDAVKQLFELDRKKWESVLLAVCRHQAYEIMISKLCFRNSITMRKDPFLENCVSESRWKTRKENSQRLEFFERLGK